MTAAPSRAGRTSLPTPPRFTRGVHRSGLTQRAIGTAASLALLGGLVLSTGCSERPSTTNSLDMRMVLLEPGTFSMGKTEEGAEPAEGATQHPVTLTRAFEISATEVTRAQYEELAGAVDSRFECGPRCPADQVAWLGAIHFANLLSEREGLEPCYQVLGAGDDPYVTGVGA